ncbi:hypothetical protein [Bythopirellula polymerisocia]|uniref:DUF4175 family protein n=1 Tax=Bythopirellula polymerisocia TaxID=2528003 RepID=A0A5C6CNB0_9BACT|nr:hypothetical protein [Bythopirellula polymerisocia]TWU26010.1 hypothetical protein Pla144_32270 [Bythopirellula polymerisocia]
MSRIESNNRVGMPRSLETQLLAFRRHVWTSKMLEAGGIALSALLGAYLCVFLLDRMFDVPAPIRALLTLLAAVGCGFIPFYLHRWVWLRRRNDQLARLLARKLPTLGDQLLGVIELADNTAEQQRSPALCLAAIQQGAQTAGERDLSVGAPPARLKFWGALAASGAAGALLLALLFPAAAGNAWHRFLVPWKTVPRYTFTNVEPQPSTLIVAHGEPFSVAWQLRDETKWRPAEASFQFGSQPPVTSTRTDSAYTWTGPPLIQPGTLLVKIGDWSQTVRIEPKLRPELTALTAEVKLPDYLKQKTPLERDVRGGTLSVVEGSHASVSATANRPLAAAVIEGGKGTFSGGNVSIEPFEVSSLQEIHISWQDEHGLKGKEPFSLKITPEEDQPPNVMGENLPRRKVVLDSEQLAFQAIARDDFGVREVGMEWEGLFDDYPGGPAHGERLIAPGDPSERALDAAGTFTAKSLGIPPQPISLRLFATDYFPNRERVYSPPYVLFVLNAEDHAIWITEQLSRWHRQSLEVRDREMRLYETNKQLRELPIAELDLPENRRQIEKQASAERANGRRLTGLAKSGMDLLKQAARNPEIGVGHLDRWAEMLTILEDIAANRMPSVADLLGDAAKSQIASTAVSGPSSPQAGISRTAGGGPSGEQKPSDKKTAAVPRVTDMESSQHPANDKEQTAGGKKKPSSPSLRLPVTTLLGKGDGKKPSDAPANEQVDEAVRQQRDLLAEFEKVANELNTVLANLEGSTLVKRLKAASREQYKIAGGISDEIEEGFGVPQTSLTAPVKKSLTNLATKEDESGFKVSLIMDDLQAYFERRRMVRFKTVLDDMREEDVLGNLRRLADEIPAERGMSIAQCEYWSDVMDRWAEDLVDPACSGACPGSRSKGSLPPSIVLEVLKILEGEVNLREETRVAEQARPGLEAEPYKIEAERLSATQQDLGERILLVNERIRELPDGEAEFAKELALLSRVNEVMVEATGILSKPDTGSEAIAAETEAIELLLQSKRINPNGGGGGGANPGGGGGGDTKDNALALLGAGLNEKEVREDRAPAQAVGDSGKSLPEEFRAGLDRYFSELENGAGG